MAGLKEYYSNLLILQYHDQTRAKATVEAQADAVIMDQLPIQVQNAFELETAIGTQLDVLGKYIGLSRNGYDFSGAVTLNDDQYRQALKIKIVQNNYGSSLQEIQMFLNIFFLNQIYIFDYENMRIGYFLDEDVGDQTLAEFFIKQRLLPKPMGVQLSATIYGPTVNNFFGFRTYNNVAVNNSPFNTYDAYEMDRPWLKYDDALTP